MGSLMRPLLLALFVVSVIAQPDATRHGASAALALMQFFLLIALGFTHPPTTQDPPPPNGDSIP